MGRRVPGSVLSYIAVAPTRMYEVSLPGELQVSPEVKQPDPQDEVEDEWPMEAIVMGDGSRDASALAVQKGKVHASGQALWARELVEREHLYWSAECDADAADVRFAWGRAQGSCAGVCGSC